MTCAKFLIVTPLAVDGFSGDSVHVRELARALQRRQALTAVVASGRHFPTGDSALGLEGVPFVSIGPGKGKRVRRMLRMLRHCWRLAPNADAILTRDFLTAVMCLPLARLRGCKPVFEVNGVPSFLLTTTAAGRFKRWLFGYILSSQDAVVFVSDNDERIYRRHYGWLQGNLIDNGVNQRLYKPIPHEARMAVRRSLGIPQEGPVIVLAGLLTNLVPLREAIDAVAFLRARFPSITFLVIGDGSARQDMEAYARTLGGGHICFLGALNEVDLAPIIASSDIGLSLYQPTRIPLDKESNSPYSMKLLTYLSCGTPVITNVRNLFLQGSIACVHVESLAREDLVGAIVRLASTQAYSAIREEARLAIAPRYTWDRSAADWLDVLAKGKDDPDGTPGEK